MADEELPKGKPKAAAVSVECHGRLRHGVVAIGGESTGTTITFQQVTWELNLSDNASQEFATRNHKEPVIVTGTLRRVEGIEVRDRWIVDVTKFTEIKSRERFEEAASVQIRGTLRVALASKGDMPDFSIQTDDQRWPLDFSADRRKQATAETLIGMPVVVSGNVVAPPEKGERESPKSRTPEMPSVQVRIIEAAPNAAGDARFFE
jgi:hypothetical protein